MFTNDPLREKVQEDFTRELQSYLKSRLPKHMVPAHFVIADTLPLTPAGKVDRNALPAPDITRVDLGRERRPPATPTEHALAAIWRDVLGLDEVGIQDDFFFLGGHSLKATQVVSQVYRRLGVQIPLREIFNRPVIAELAAAIDSETSADFQPIKRVPDADDYPLSHAQRRLWVLSQMDAASRAYNMPAALLLDGKIDENAFHGAVRQLASRHSSLRTSFAMVNGEPRQRIHSASYAPRRSRTYRRSQTLNNVRESSRAKMQSPHSISGTGHCSEFTLFESPKTGMFCCSTYITLFRTTAA